MTGAELTITCIVAIAVIVAMEPWSRFVHRALWHRLLYRVHITHHPEPGLKRPPTLLEANDLFSVLHALPAVAALYWGLWHAGGIPAALAVGLGAGMSLYGVTYMVVHDGLAHGRLPVGFLMRARYIRRVRAAHEIHHRTGAAPYGLFMGPQELRDEARRSAREAQSGVAAGGAQAK